MNILKIKNILWAIPVMMISCAHTSTSNSYNKLFASLFASPNFEVSKDSVNLGKNGFKIEGVLQNMPNNLVVIFEYTPENVIFIDSARTDATGRFTLQHIVNSEVICYLQFGEKLGFPTAVNNFTDMKLNIKASEEGIGYLLEGENISTAQQIKALTELNSGYLFKLNSLQMQAMGYDPTVSTPEQMADARKQMFSVQEEQKEAIVAEMLAGEPSLAPFFALKYLMQDPDYSAIQKGFEKCNKYNEKSIYTEILKNWAEMEKSTAIGFPAPAINLKTPEGKLLPLSSFKGKVVLIDFWASWCGPCMRAMPEMKAINAKFAGQPFAIYGVSLDRDSNSWVNTIKSAGLNWHHVSDIKYWNCVAAKAYSVSGIPATFLIDKNGNIAGKNLHGPELEAKIERLLAAPAPAAKAAPKKK